MECTIDRKGQVVELKRKNNPVSTNSGMFPMIVRRIKCPNYFILKNGARGFKTIPHKAFGHLNNKDCREVSKEFQEMMGVRVNVRNWQFDKDKFGKKIVDWGDYFQPVVSAAFAIEHIWDPLNSVCSQQCRGRCMKGMGKIQEKSVKRLTG